MKIESQHEKTLLRAIATHRRKYEVLQQRVILRSGKYRYSKNAEKLKSYYTNEISCCDLLINELIKSSSLKRRKTSKFLSDQERIEIEQTLISGYYSIKELAIKYGQSYENISVIKRGLGLARTYKKRK
jgi:hypothetical protein